MFGDDAVPGALSALCAAAGVGLVVPAAAAGLCCGQPFASKGFPAAADAAARRLAGALLAVAGADPLLVTDTSTCASQLDHAEHALAEVQRAPWRALRRLHPAQAVVEVLLPRLRARGRLRPGDEALVLHPTCSEHRHGWTPALREAARGASGGTVTVPAAAGCCGMAGDKGWTTPALTAGASAREAAEAAGSSCGVATSATCAAALSAASGVPYRHLFALLAERLVEAD
jgi:D-lactate dehydrogenase